MTKTTMPLSIIDLILNGELNEKFKATKSDFLITNSINDNLDRNVRRVHNEILDKVRISSKLETSLINKNIFT